jgi:hypothetical protein
VISIEPREDGIDVVARIRGVGVYLDNDSLIDIARGDRGRRARFTNAIRQKGSLIFSMASAVDLSGPTLAGTIGDLREFLDGFENAWFPADLNPWALSRRELAGNGDSSPLMSPVFTEAFLKQRAYDLSLDGGELPDTFFRVSAVVDWAQQDREDARAGLEKIDRTLIERVQLERELYDNDRSALDRQIPAIRYDERWPATFVLHALLRLLVKEAKGYKLKKGDGLDLCHAVIGTAYASVTTVDREWKRRLTAAIPRGLPTARFFYRPELDRLIETVVQAPAP